MGGTGKQAGKQAVSVKVALVPEKPDFLNELNDKLDVLANDLLFYMCIAEAGSPNLQSMTFETMERAPKGLQKGIAIAVYNSTVRAVITGHQMGGVFSEAFHNASKALLGAAGVNMQDPLALPATQAMVSLGILAILIPSILRDLGFPARHEPRGLIGTWAGSWQENFGGTVHVHYLCIYLSNLGQFYKGPDPLYATAPAPVVVDAIDQPLLMAPTNLREHDDGTNTSQQPQLKVLDFLPTWTEEYSAVS